METLKRKSKKLSNSINTYLNYIAEFAEVENEINIEKGEELLKDFESIINQIKFIKSENFMKKEAELLYDYLQLKEFTEINFKEMSESDLILFCKKEKLDETFLIYSEFFKNWENWNDKDFVVVALIKQLKKIIEKNVFINE